MRNGVIHVWREDSVIEDDTIEYRTTIEVDGQRHNLWYTCAAQYAPYITSTMDPYLVGSIFLAMQYGDRLVVHGPVSSDLLRNLERFQEIWAYWESDRYHKVELLAEEELQPAPPVNDDALVSFSGGVDSCFTVHRHLERMCGRQTETIGAALMIHGFDIPLQMRSAFDTVAHSAEQILASRGVPLLRLTSNWREIMDDLHISWEDSHGTSLIACLSLFQNGFGVGLLASSLEYDPMIPYGSSPLTDPLLASDRFRIVHDGAHVRRLHKLPVIATWPDAMDHLRVCWERPELAGNCCECEKCLRTMLGFRAMGMPLPGAFPRDVSDEQIKSIQILRETGYHHFDLVRQEAIRRGMGDESWVRALSYAMAQYGRGEHPVMALRRRLKLRTRIKGLLGMAPVSGGSG